VLVSATTKYLELQAIIPSFPKHISFTAAKFVTEIRIKSLGVVATATPLCASQKVVDMH
jgi:hypothetical protein